MFEFRAELIRVVDGDTVDLLVDLGFNTFIRDRFRLLGINAYEMRGEEREKGLKAKDCLIDAMNDKELIITTSKNPKGKYGRWLATIHADGVNINQLLVEKGHAVFKDY